MCEIIESWIKRIEAVERIDEYERQIDEMKRVLADCVDDIDILNTVNEKSRFVKNIFSESTNMENMKKSRDELVIYLRGLLLRKEASFDHVDFLIHYLEKFPLFLKAFKRDNLHKSATIKKEELEAIEIQNEYDLQHLLYAILTPMFEDIRKEVSDDSGVGSVRADIKIPSLHTVIEAKCTRGSMNLRSLTEEIEADIVHYTADTIIFVVYDRKDIVIEKGNYEKNFTRMFDGKNVKMIVLQAISL